MFSTTRALSSLVLAVLGVFAAFVPAVSKAADCTCEQLPLLQKELRQAQRLRENFRNHIPTLRTFLGRGESLGEHTRFAGAEALRGLDPPPPGQPVHFENVMWGENVAESRLDSFTKEQLCAMRQSSALELAEMLRRTPCADIAQSLQAHENVHQATCLQKGYRGYLDMHGTERAAEEVAAYGAQIAVLRVAIARVLEKADVRVKLEMTERVQMPPVPTMTLVIDHWQSGELHAVGAVMDGELIRLNVQGNETNNSEIVAGICRFSSGFPYTRTAYGSMHTDGLEAQLRYLPEHTAPPIGMHCRFGNREHDVGMSAEAPRDTTGQTPFEATVLLSNGASKIFDMAADPGAVSAMAETGVQISGQAKLSLVLECPASR